LLRKAALEALESRVLLSATVSINAANQLAFVGESGNDDVTVSFAPDSSGGTYTISDLAAPIDVVANTGSGVVTAGSGTNTITVTNLSFLDSASLSLEGNGNSGVAPGDTFDIQSTNDPISIDQNGTAPAHDSYDLGNSINGVQGILAPVSLKDTTSLAEVTVDDSADAAGQSFTLAGGASTSAITDLAPGSITYTNGAISSLTIDAGNGSDTLTVDFSGGNPIPALATPGLIYSGGGGADNILNLDGVPPSGPFSSVVPKASGPGSGSITFVDSGGTSTELTYADLTPITDTTPAIDYTFNDFATPDPSFSITTGPVVSGFQTMELSNLATPATFETTDIANKNFVIFNGATPSVDYLASIDLPLASTGLLSLTVNTTAGLDDQINVVNTPPGVVTSVNTGGGSDVVNVTGMGIASGTVTFVDTGTGNDTLNYDAGGETPTVTPGLLPGEVLIAIPGAGVVDVINCENIHITNVAAPAPVLDASVTLTGVEGQNTGQETFATFNTSVSGAIASDFTASIDFGDGSPVTGGSIVQDAIDPTKFYVEGSHTFSEEGIYTRVVSVRYRGGSYDSMANGVAVTTTVNAAILATASGDVDIADAALFASPLTISGQATVKLSKVSVATFVDSGGPEAPTNYTTTIHWGDGASSAGTVIANGPNFQVTGSHTYAASGSYVTTITIADDGDAATIVTGEAKIASAPVIASKGATISGHEGRTLSATVATFTDSFTGASASDFTASVNWGDGATTAGTVVKDSPGKFHISASHAYAEELPSGYTVKVTIHKPGGSTTTVNSLAKIADSPLDQPSNLTLTQSANVSFTNKTVGTFRDQDSLNTSPSDYVGTIDWGDGKSSSAKFVFDHATFNVGSYWAVQGSHRYTTKKIYAVKITLHDTGSSASSALIITATIKVV
jgi:hypothetical protein